jgi:hypothetical protein
MNCGGIVKPAHPQRETGKVETSSQPPGPLLFGQHLDDTVPPGTKKVVRMAKDRGTRILLMPRGMTKRRENSTKYDSRKQKLFWAAQLVFVKADEVDVSSLLRINFESPSISKAHVSLFLTSIDEDNTIGDFVSEILCHGGLRKGKRDEILNHRLKSALAPIRKEGAKLRCFIQRLPGRSDSPKFHPVNMSSTLRQTLEEKTVIEFPTLFIVPDGLRTDFTTLISVEQERLHSDSPEAKFVTCADFVNTEAYDSKNMESNTDEICHDERKQESTEGSSVENHREHFEAMKKRLGAFLEEDCKLEYERDAADKEEAQNSPKKLRKMLDDTFQTMCAVTLDPVEAS